MLGKVLLIAMLTTAPDVTALRKELDAVATRIEDLKARREAGESVEDELTRLLIRSQDLAEEIEQARPHPPPAAARPLLSDPAREFVDELREYAGELHEEIDRLRGELAEVDARIAELRFRGAAAEPRSTPAQSAVVVTQDSARDLPGLLELRRMLAGSIRALRLQVSNLEEAADAMERNGREE